MPANAPVSLFVSYSHKDRRHQDRLEIALAQLRRDNLIAAWHDQMITPGDDWEQSIQEALETADIVLLLVSPDFMASEYSFNKELARAIERHERGETRVIPVIVRPADWRSAPFARFQALPSRARAVTEWPNRDRAWADIATGVRRIVTELSDTRRVVERRPEAVEPEPPHSHVDLTDPAAPVGSRDTSADDVDRDQQDAAPPASFLVTMWVTPLAKRLGQLWLDAVRDRVDDAIGALLARLVAATASRDDDTRIRGTRDAEDALVGALEQDPAQVRHLWEAIRYPRVAVDDSADRATRLAAQFHAMLVFAFDRVAQLGVPVALPGFFNSSVCVSVIDARTDDDVRLPSITEPDSLGMHSLKPYIWLGGEEALEYGMPRVWVLRAESEPKRDALLSELDALLSHPRRAPSPRILGLELSNHVNADQVDAVHSDRVKPLRPRPRHDATLTAAERVAIALQSQPEDEDSFYDVQRPDGMRLLFDRLAERLRQQWDADRVWG